MESKQLGPYRMGRQLGRGGMGAVYEGVNVETDELAAVKVLSAALASEPDFRQRFALEIETLRKLYHPNIVQLFGFGEQDGVLFYAMELVNGSSLEEELRRGRVFPWREVAEIGIETCRALRHAHDRGVIHRDIKPANLLLTKEGTIKLSDFGIARLFGFARVTAVGNVLGTVEYMAPEQADARPVTPRTDLYSLGGVLYCLLTRRTPFQAQSLAEMLEKHRSALPEPIGRFARDVPVEFELIISQLLEKDPEKRIANATLLARRLQAMVRALSVIPSTVENRELHRLQQESEPADASPPIAAPSPDSLPETRLLTAADPSPVGPDTPTRATGDVSPETAEDSAFVVRGGAAEGPHPHRLPNGEGTSDHLLPQGEGTNGAVKAPTEENTPAPTRHFVAVAEEDLDREEPAGPPRHPLISLHTWVLGAALLLTGLAAWYLLQPPSADTLYARIMAATADGSIQSLEDAEPQIKDYLQRYSEGFYDPRCEQLRRFQREIKISQLQRKLERRAKGEAGLPELLPIERAYVDAVRDAAYDPKKALTKLHALLDLYPGRKDFPGEAGECLELARRQIDHLDQPAEKAAKESLYELDQRLKVAEDLQRSDPTAANAIRQAVIELYQDKPWAAEKVQQARKALDAEPSKKETRKQP